MWISSDNNKNRLCLLSKCSACAHIFAHTASDRNRNIFAYAIEDVTSQHTDLFVILFVTIDIRC